MREYRCRDIGMDCDFVARARKDEEVVEQARAHARRVHDMEVLPQDILRKITASLHSV